MIRKIVLKSEYPMVTYVNGVKLLDKLNNTFYVKKKSLLYFECKPENGFPFCFSIGEDFTLQALPSFLKIALINDDLYFFIEKSACFFKNKFVETTIKTDYGSHSLVEYDNSEFLLFSNKNAIDFTLSPYSFFDENSVYLFSSSETERETQIINISSDLFLFTKNSRSVVIQINDAYKIIYSGGSIKAHYLNDELTVEEHFCDTLSTVKKTLFKKTHDLYEIINVEFSTENKNSKNILLCFLDCIKAENYKKAKDYLSEDLQNLLTEDNLKEFFGNIVYIFLSEALKKNCVTLLKQTSSDIYLSASYKLAITNNKISDIEEI